MAPRTLLAALVALALIPSSAAAAAPKFPRQYKGTISGVQKIDRNGAIITKTWSITKLVFTRFRIKPFEGGYTGMYKVTRGQVDYNEFKTGACTYEIGEQFSLPKAMPRRMISTPFAFDKSPLGRFTYDGSLDVTTKFTVGETCTYEDSSDVNFVTVNPPDFFRTGSKRGRLGRTLKGKFVYDDEPYGTRTYKWSLRPSRR
jgi:hypothetical protein